MSNRPLSRSIKYSETLEKLENLAYSGGYGADWLEEVGENVKFYALLCESKGIRPTFSGLIRHLESLIH